MANFPFDFRLPTTVESVVAFSQSLNFLNDWNDWNDLND